MTYILMLALLKSGGGMYEYEKTPLLCMDHKYVFTRDGDPLVYLRNTTKEYASKFKTADELEKEIKKQCQK